jgi:hypothetical protein
MPQVSVASIDSLLDALAAIKRVAAAVAEECGKACAYLDARCEQSENECRKLAWEVSAARNAEIAADRAFNLAQAELSAARSALSSCINQPPDETGKSPDCSGEREDVSAAKNAVYTAKDELEKATVKRAVLERASETLERSAAQLSQARDKFWNMSNTRIAQTSEIVAVAKQRIAPAYAALEAYLSAHAARAFSNWKNWKPPVGKPLSPADIRDRMAFSPAMLQHYIQSLIDSDLKLLEKVKNYRAQIASIRADGKRDIRPVLRQVHRNFSGSIAERLVADAFRPLCGEVITQIRTELPDGHNTIIDIVCKDFKEEFVLDTVPFVLGKEPLVLKRKGRYVPKGGSLAIEVKTGSPDYIYTQMKHMLRQALGHKSGADAGITICTWDIERLGEEKKEELCGALSRVGSPLFGILPTKAEFDTAWDKVILGLPPKANNKKAAANQTTEGGKQ